MDNLDKNIINDFLKNRNSYLELTKNNIDLEKFNYFSITHHSNSLEGSTLTKGETFLLLDEQLTPKNKPLEHTFMALDHKEALEFVISKSKENPKITPKLIQNIGALVLKNTGSFISSMGGNFDSSKGEFRKLTTFAGTRTFPNHLKVPKLVETLSNEINRIEKGLKEPIKVNSLAFDAHFQLVSIHPFADGNGRTSRLLMNLIQAKHNEPLSAIKKENKQDYFNALEETRKKENPNIFRNFMFKESSNFLKEQIKDLKKELKPKKRNGFTFMF